MKDTSLPMRHQRPSRGSRRTAYGKLADRFNRKQVCPNRPLNLNDLRRPSYRKIVDRLARMTEREEVTYFHPSKRWEYPWALERADLTPGSRVLDLGCGASIFPIYLAEEGHRVTAADLVLPGRVDLLYSVSIDYVEADLSALPFPEASFDVIFCISVIEHLPREALIHAFGEMQRVIRKGGRLLVTTDYYEDAGAELWYEGPGPRFKVDWNFFDEPELRKLMFSLPRLEVKGEVDLEVNWSVVSPQMRKFHGYPYTTMGFALVKT